MRLACRLAAARPPIDPADLSRPGAAMPKLSPWAFVLAAPDLDRSAAHYRDVLGFRASWPDGRDWRLVERGGMRLMPGHRAADTPAAEIGSHNWLGYVAVDDVNAFRAEITARGAVTPAPKDASYGMGEIVVTTVDGHHFAFGQELGR